MSTTIYRKYRPQTFGQVAEQNHVVKTLQNEIAADRVSHAYVFAGPRGVGKTTVARLFAKALLCRGKAPGSGEACDTCSDCVQFVAGQMIDFLEIDAASNTGVDAVRENIIEGVRFAPTQGRYKIFLIDEVHMLSSAAFNALLKTLEEPPAHAIFILATTELHKLPATVLSRCEKFIFKKIPITAIVATLQAIADKEGVKFDQAVLLRIAKLAEGGLRDAESLLGQLLPLGGEITIDRAATVIPMGNTEAVLEIIQSLLQGDLPRTLAELSSLNEAGISAKLILEELMDFVRLLMVVQLNGSVDDAIDDHTKTRIEQLKALSNAKQVLTLLDLFIAAWQLSVPAESPLIAIELACAKFVSIRTDGQLTVRTSAPANPPSLPPIKKPDPAPIPTPPTPKPPAPVAKPETPALFSAPTETIVTPPSHSPNPIAPSSPIDLADLQGKWGRCLEIARKVGPTFAMMIGNSKPTAINERGAIVVSFPYAINVSHMKQPKNALALEEAIKEIMIVPAVALEFIQEKATAGDPVDDLLTQFGGSVV